jgi:hypothetical protein
MPIVRGSSEKRLHQATLFECTPSSTRHSRATDLTVNETATGHIPRNMTAKQNAAISDHIHDEGLKMNPSETAQFQYIIHLAKFGYEPPR